MVGPLNCPGRKVGAHHPSSMPRVHTRDHGFNHDLVTEDVAAVITTAAARLVANPEQLHY